MRLWSAWSADDTHRGSHWAGSEPEKCLRPKELRLFSPRSLTKNLFNPQFGSIFRTFHNPTYFSRRLVRFSDIYMASISCLLNYDVNFTFYPRRTPLQHEAPLWMDQLCTGCMKTPFLEEMVHIR